MPITRATIPMKHIIVTISGSLGVIHGSPAAFERYPPGEGSRRVGPVLQCAAAKSWRTRMNRAETRPSIVQRQ
ncbi:hypothetical protein BDN67DRAFT_997321 [Paxillus ammoniavirescens]|nr:hypothetical protein BDN67DRAFT_997321 [Paxillus ammoniavirescens]